MIFNIILIIVGFIILIKGADLLVGGATQVAKRFHISEMIIGMTIVAMGTSLPEILVSVKGAMGGHSDIALGNVIGSNLVNLLFILGICAIMAKNGMKIEKSVRTFDTPFNLIVTFVLLVLCNFGAHMLGVTRGEGIFLLLVFAAYLIYIIVKAKRDSSKEKITNEEKKIPMYKAILYILIGIVGLKFGADFVVDNTVIVAQAIGISEKIIGLTIIAIGTSLPELVSSIAAVKKGENDLAIGNIIGSNIFNILLILGVASVISPIQYNSTYNLDIVILFFSTLLLMFFPYMGQKGKLTRNEGILYVAIYIIYILTLLVIR